jgi:hypothetical protein
MGLVLPAGVKPLTKNPTLTIEFDPESGTAKCTSNNFPAPMRLAVCHMTSDGSWVIVAHPFEPSKAQ